MGRPWHTLPMFRNRNYWVDTLVYIEDLHKSCSPSLILVHIGQLWALNYVFGIQIIDFL
jgi:hypothetical protein